MREQEHIVDTLAGDLAQQENCSSATEFARRRGWRDDTGALTKKGQDVAQAVLDQGHTRSVFRV